MWLRIRPTNVLQEVMPRFLVDVISLCAAFFGAFSAYFAGFRVYLYTQFQACGAANRFQGTLFPKCDFVDFGGDNNFALFGFYTHTRTYQNRYRFLVIINAVSLAFLIEVLLYSYVMSLYG